MTLLYVFTRLPTWMMTQGIISVVWVVLLIVSKKLKGKMEDALQLQYGDHLARDDIVRSILPETGNEKGKRKKATAAHLKAW